MRKVVVACVLAIVLMGCSSEEVGEVTNSANEGNAEPHMQREVEPLEALVVARINLRSDGLVLQDLLSEESVQSKQLDEKVLVGEMLALGNGYWGVFAFDETTVFMNRDEDDRIVALGLEEEARLYFLVFNAELQLEQAFLITDENLFFTLNRAATPTYEAGELTFFYILLDAVYVYHANENDTQRFLDLDAEELGFPQVYFTTPEQLAFAGTNSQGLVTYGFVRFDTEEVFVFTEEAFHINEVTLGQTHLVVSEESSSPLTDAEPARDEILTLNLQTGESRTVTLNEGDSHNVWSLHNGESLFAFSWDEETGRRLRVYDFDTVEVVFERDIALPDAASIEEVVELAENRYGVVYLLDEIYHLKEIEIGPLN